MSTSLIRTAAIIAFSLAWAGNIQAQERKPPKIAVDPAQEVPAGNPFQRPMFWWVARDNAGNLTPNWWFAPPPFAPAAFRFPERPFDNGIGGIPGGYGGALIIDGKLPRAK